MNTHGSEVQLILKTAIHTRDTEMADTNRELIANYQADPTRDNMWRIIETNEGLVLRVVGKYQKYGDIDDLKQEGYLGLIKAAEKFDLTLDYAFSTYATYWIEQAISRYLCIHQRQVRIPINYLEKIMLIQRTQAQSINENGEMISIEDAVKTACRLEIDEYMRKYKSVNRQVSNSRLAIAEKNYIKKLVEQYQSAIVINNIASVDEPIVTDNDEPDSTLLTYLESDELQPADKYEHVYMADVLKKAMSKLTDREQYILKCRFGLNNHTPETRVAIAQRFGVTQERIRQIEARALYKLKHNSSLLSLKRDYEEMLM